MLKALKDFLFPEVVMHMPAVTSLEVRILKDGVFPAADKRADKGEIVTCDRQVAKALIERGDAERV